MLEEPKLIKKKNRKNKYVFFSILTMFLTLGITYGVVFYIQQYQSSALGLTSELLNVSITENGSVGISNASGQKDNEGITNSKTTFVITNTSNAVVNVKISIVEDSNSTLSNDQVRYAVFETGNIVNLGDLSEKDNLIYEFEVEKGETVTLQSTIWLDYYYEGENESFRGKYNVVAENIDEYARIYLTKLIDKDKGLVRISDTEYRYNTATPDNYVWFNSELWRIIGVINNQVEIVRNDSFTETDVNAFYSSIPTFHKNYVDPSIVPSLLTTTDTYNGSWIDNTTKKARLTLLKNIYIIDGNGTINDPYLINDSVHIPVYYKFEKDFEPYLLSDDGDTRIISGSKDELTNNYIWYSGKLWRIMALNNDGSIKIVTDDSITTISYNEALSEDCTAFKKSYMYQWLNEDFLDTLYNYEDLIVMDYSWNNTVSPSSSTFPKLDNISIVKSPVGSLNIYEYVKSYSRLGVYSSSSAYSNGYLNNGYRSFTITPYNDNKVFYIDSSGAVQNFYILSSSYGIRPSINLKPSIEISDGDGTIINPYILVGDRKKANANNNLNSRESGEYVNFDEELYRIVGIENNITKITKVDYIRNNMNDAITKAFSSNISNNLYGEAGTTASEWAGYLNDNTATGWYGSITQSYKDMIVNGTWYLGSVGSSRESYKNAICRDVNTLSQTKTCERTGNTYNGYVGLGRIGEMFTSQQGNSSSTSTSMWTITPSSEISSTNYINNQGINIVGDGNEEYAARPSINLSSSVKIVSGTGLKNDPFEITMN